jgi:hypothetical protein
MITGQGRFNLYLSLAIVLVLAGGCRTDKHDQKKLFATLRIHLEASAVDTDRSIEVPIYRATPFKLQMQQEPFLTEAHVASAKVVDALGGFDLQIQLNREGTWLFQQASANNRGKHFAIFSQFGPKGKESRWLAAPQFSRLVSDGLIQFTPDASREECDQIALGLNNLAKKNDTNQKW